MGLARSRGVKDGAFVALTDPAALARGWQQVVG
jgi:hypothetical protein